MRFFRATERKNKRCIKMEYLILASKGLEEFVQEAIAKSLEQYQCTILPLFGESIDYQALLQQLRAAQAKKCTRLARKRQNYEIDNLRECFNHKVGAIRIETGSDIYIGFHGNKTIISCAGVAEGTILLKLSTDAPCFKVLSLRTLGCGPIFAYICHDTSAICNPCKSLDEAKISITEMINNVHVFKKALDLWICAATTAWPRLWPNECDNKYVMQVLSKKSNFELYSFRASCLRTKSESYSYLREALTKVMGDAIPFAWKVDMRNYDIEIVSMVYTNVGTALGLTLLPYQFLSNRNLSSGKLTPDIIPPFVTQGLQNLVSLRPSTAALLLHIANLQEGDVLLDMCAGIGTLPHEASLHPVVAIGGDVDGEKLQPHMSTYAKRMREFHKQSADMMVWDAALLPLRDQFVDVVISDLPFGQKCLSSHEVNQLLTPVVSELARVVVKTTGRLVLLCGAFTPVLDALLANNLFDSPSSIVPVNVGGFAAWIIIVSRNKKPWERHLPNHRARVQKLAQRRRIRQLGTK